MNDFTLVVDPTVPKGEVWVDGQGLRVDMTGGRLRLIPTGDRPITLHVREADQPLPFATDRTDLSARDIQRSSSPKDAA